MRARPLNGKGTSFEVPFESCIRRRHRLPGRVQPSTFSAKRLNFRVRDENGWVPLAIATGMVGYVLHIHNCIVQLDRCKITYLPNRLKLFV